jgi:hypothetical protein
VVDQAGQAASVVEAKDKADQVGQAASVVEAKDKAASADKVGQAASVVEAKDKAASVVVVSVGVLQAIVSLSFLARGQDLPKANLCIGPFSD